jgi:hypothetical protein
VFNQLWFNGLMLKLHQLDCPKHLMAWLWNYLSNRSSYKETWMDPVSDQLSLSYILTALKTSFHIWSLSLLIPASANWSSKTVIPKLIEQMKHMSFI